MILSRELFMYLPLKGSFLLFLLKTFWNCHRISKDYLIKSWYNHFPHNFSFIICKNVKVLRFNLSWVLKFKKINSIILKRLLCQWCKLVCSIYSFYIRFELKFNLSFFFLIRCRPYSLYTLIKENCRQTSNQKAFC